MKAILFLVSTLLVINPEYGMAKEGDAGDKTITIDIPTDLPPPASAEEVLPTHPFFSESTGNEVMEKVQELEARIEKLEKSVSQLEEKKS
jgi:hypothetical protein